MRRVVRYGSARTMWHDAFDPQIKSMNPRDNMIFGGDGDKDFKIVNQVEKGYVQQVIAKLREQNIVAWAWGMVAYTPADFRTPEAHAILKAFMRAKIRERELKERKSTLIGSVAEIKILMLARIGYEDYACEDRNGTGRKRRRYSEMKKVVDYGEESGIAEEEYAKSWHKYYVWAREISATLPEPALTPLDALKWDMRDLEAGRPGAAEQLQGTLCRERANPEIKGRRDEEREQPAAT